MTNEALDDLVKIGKLEAEVSSDREIHGLVKSELARLQVANNVSLSIESSFDENPLSDSRGYIEYDLALIPALLWKEYVPTVCFLHRGSRQKRIAGFTGRWVRMFIQQ